MFLGMSAGLFSQGGDASDAVTLSFWGWEASPLESAAIREGIDRFER